jgi:hypothetical protein
VGSCIGVPDDQIISFHRAALVKTVNMMKFVTILRLALLPKPKLLNLQFGNVWFVE